MLSGPGLVNQLSVTAYYFPLLYSNRGAMLGVFMKSKVETRLAFIGCMVIVFICHCVEQDPIGVLFFYVCPQAPVLHLPAASVPPQRVPAGTYATGEMEAQVAHHY